MPTVLVVSDAPWIRDEIRTALVGPGFEVLDVCRGQDVRGMVGKLNPDLLIVDLQIGNMGGIAVTMDLRLEESGGRLPHFPVLLLLEREADRFLARRADAEAMLVKPLDVGVLRRTVKQLLGVHATPVHNVGI